MLFESPEFEEKTFSPIKIIFSILKEFIGLSNDRFHFSTNKVFLTIPSYFNEKQKEEFLNAAKMAEIEVIDLLLEPIAADIAYNSSLID
jgi:molecular chaperone DnaK (HSP70)